MSRVTRRSFALGLGALGLGRVARADAIDDALARVARARAGLRTLVGPFTQERTIGLLAARVRSTGTLTLVRPDRLRWELAPPDAITYWFTPEGLAYRGGGGAGTDGKHNQGHVSPAQSTLAASLDDLRTLLGGDLSRLRARYDLRLVSDGAEGLAFDATPHDPALPIKRLAFGLAPDGAIPRFAELIEGPRDKTRIDFGALQRDATVDPALVRPPT
jgi:hypothetical protein